MENIHIAVFVIDKNSNSSVAVNIQLGRIPAIRFGLLLAEYQRYFVILIRRVFAYICGASGFKFVYVKIFSNVKKLLFCFGIAEMPANLRHMHLIRKMSF